MEQTIYLAGGCFWGVQKFFDQFEGVIKTRVGYANGPDRQPDYQEVCAGSGHAETVEIEYEDTTISLQTLLDHYFLVIDPYSVNRQGNDVGIQYRTGIYATTPEQLSAAQTYIKEKEKGRKMAVEVEMLQNFYSAEDMHQKYLDKNPNGYCHIPKSYFSLSSDK